MKKYSGVVVTGLLALFIGLILSIQIGTTDGGEQGGLVPLGKLKGYEAELKKIKEEKDLATQQLLELEERLASIEAEKTAEDALLSGMVADLEKFRMYAGVVDVQGPGLLITIKDPVMDQYQEDYSVITNNSELLVLLINRLKEAGAEAVSVNEHRIAGTTEISLAGENININGTATAPPYAVKAIGNPDILEAALTMRGGIVYNMKTKYNLIVSFEKKEKLVIGRYTEPIRFRYAVPVEKEQAEQ